MNTAMVILHTAMMITLHPDRWREPPNHTRLNEAGDTEPPTSAATAGPSARITRHPYSNHARNHRYQYDHLLIILTRCPLSAACIADQLSVGRSARVRSTPRPASSLGRTRLSQPGTTCLTAQTLNTVALLSRHLRAEEGATDAPRYDAIVSATGDSP